MKTCEKCGIVNTDEAVFCTACGAPLAQAPVAEEAPIPFTSEPVTEQAVPVEPAAPVAPAPAVTYEQTADVPAANDAYAYTAPAAPAAENKATLWLILNIVLTVVCCGNILGIIGIVFSALGMSSYSKGNYDDMNQKVKTAKILFIVGAALGVLGGIIALASGVLSAVMNR